MTGRKRLIVQAAATRLRRAGTDTNKTMAEFGHTLKQVEEQLADILSEAEVSEVLEEAAEAIEQENAMQLLQTLGMTDPAAIQKLAVGAADEKVDKGIPEPKPVPPVPGRA